MKISDAIATLMNIREQFGELDIVVWDQDQCFCEPVKSIALHEGVGSEVLIQ